MTRKFGLSRLFLAPPPALLGLVLLAAVLSPNGSVRAAPSTPVNVGYRDFSFGTSVNSTPTGEKPESKLWWNDGTWWGVLWDTTLNSHAIYRFDASAQTWASTGTKVDARTGSKADALWDGQRLYVVSHIFSTSPGPTTSSNAGRLFRYSYDSVVRTYQLDAGYPVNVNGSTSETLVLDKDSTGKLWVTWMESLKVKVNRTVGNDLTWGVPFDLPVQGGNVNSDDISSVIAFGNKIGVMWSNQVDKKTYFAVHVDGAADAIWQAREEALAEAGLALADDHLNLKVSCDADGALYAVTKTSLTSSTDPLIYVLKRSPTGSWSRYLAGTVADSHSRPILLLDKDMNTVYVFAEGDKTGRQLIYMKAASTANLQFPTGVGTPFIDSSADVSINNPTSTKQCVSGATGLLVLASDAGTHFYLHNFMDLGGVAPAVTAFNPTFGLAGQEITITGARFTGATGVGFNGTPAGSFVVDSKNQIRAIVPAGASTGRITVSTAVGTGISAADFVVVVAPTIASFAPTSGPVGTEVTVQGSHFTGVTAVAFNGTAASSFTVDSDVALRATVAAGTTTGTIRVTNGAGSAESGPVFTVTPGPSQVVFIPTDDTRVDSADKTQNFGSSTYLRVKSISATHYSYLKFNVTGVSGTVQSAKIRLYCTDPSDDGGSIFTVSNNYPGTTTPWLESGVTWNNAPTIGGTPLDQKGAVALNTWVEFTVTPAISGNGIYSFGITSGSPNSVYYSSSEGTHPPELVVLVSSGAAPPANLAPSTVVDNITPRAFVLRQNRPNPFRARTSIRFELPRPGKVRLTIYDVMGRLIRTVVDGDLPAGEHEVSWDARDNGGNLVSSGVYVARIEAEGFTSTRKLLRMR